MLERAGKPRDVTTASLRFPRLTLGLAALMVVGAIAPVPLQEALSLGGGPVGKSGWWQTLTCHLVHFGWGHFWRDVPALALLCGILEVKSRTTLLAVLGVAAGVVPTAVLLFEPGILPYRGSSGLLVAVFTWLALNAILRRDVSWHARLAGIAALAVLTVKIWLELTEGRIMEAIPGEIVSVSWASHFGGALAGLFVCLLRELFLPQPTGVTPHKTNGPRCKRFIR